MALVGYSDSEDSEAEEKKAPSLKLPAPKLAKPALQKVVGRSNPGKIKVSLPDVKMSTQGVEQSTEEPPAKRPRLGDEEGWIKNFNSFLPAPKRAASSSTNGARRGLDRGVSLKTSATPGFSRKSHEDTAPNEEPSEVTEHMKNSLVDTTIIMPYFPDGKNEDHQNNDTFAKTTAKKSALTFKPLSVMRKPMKKKAITAVTASVPTAPENEMKTNAPTTLSLFSMGGDEEQMNASSIPNPIAQPYSYETIKEPSTKTEKSSSPTDDEETPQAFISPQKMEQQGAQSLNSIASDLNLSASARRQLLGRGKQNDVATNIINFNTDQEYAANEALRQAGEAQSHNPVRAIASGKHSLKQLVNAAANQKDALEEQFASGRRNKKEAGNKYGW